MFENTDKSKCNEEANLPSIAFAIHVHIKVWHTTSNITYRSNTDNSMKLLKLIECTLYHRHTYWIKVNNWRGWISHKFPIRLRQRMRAADKSYFPCYRNFKFSLSYNFNGKNGIAIDLAAGKTPRSWSNGLNGVPNSKLILSSPRPFRSDAKGA